MKPEHLYSVTVAGFFASLGTKAVGSGQAMPDGIDARRRVEITVSPCLQTSMGLT